MATAGWQNVTMRDIHRRELAKKPSKYRNVKIQADGHTFDSKHELAVYRQLQARQAAGEISELQHHPPPLDLRTLTHRPSEVTVCQYEPDFSYVEAGRTVYADAKSKGTRTAVYRLKKKWLLCQENIEIVEL